MQDLRTAVTLALLALAPMSMGVSECTVETPPANCEDMQVLLTADGALSVTNFNDEPVTVNVQINTQICTNQGCSYTGTYTDEAIGMGVTRSFLAEEGGDVCTDQFCCASGFTGSSTATVEVLEGSCGIGVAASQPFCGPFTFFQRF